MTTEEKSLVIAQGNVAAANFLCAYIKFCHLLDDVCDGEERISDTRLAADALKLLEELLLNPWVQANRIVLWPGIVLGVNAWLDANEWTAVGTPVQRRDAEVVKSVYQEIAWLTARLCGGWDHMRKMSAQFREYNHEELT
jgi:hypothetical protein